MTRVLITGATGQVGRALVQLAPQGMGLLVPSRKECDLANPEQVRSYVEKKKPAAIIHAGAYTAVDKAESEPALAYAVNAASTAALAGYAGKAGIPLLYVSTDYVFPGAILGVGQKPYREDAPVAPLSVYGRTKLAGELAVQSLAPQSTILRTSWVFSEHGTNFVKRMLELGTTRRALSIVNDQHGAPTPANAIAGALWELLARHLSTPAVALPRILHFSGQPATTWYDFAREIFRIAGGLSYTAPTLTAIPTTSYPTPAQRPLWSVLDCHEIARLGIPQPDWRKAATDAIAKVL